MPGTQAIGVISDTHGLLRPGAINALRGSDLIVHAGDIGGPEILEALRRIAPVVAVRGNNDKRDWARDLHDTEVVRAGDALLYVLHDLHELDLDPSAAGFKAVISGHSHQPKVEERAGVLYLNPGSAGPRRFRLPIAVARLRIDGSVLWPEIVELPEGRKEE
ncbi:MAG TPA: metallophosphoesterase family protein [Candidatus Polarisedimenticolia bacterium]|nr:metallophosphoesterase family protein [Candidatus Polarisedimenticolia bacterium]